MDKSSWGLALRMLGQVDWPRMLHRASVFARELRGDPEIERESLRVQQSARTMRDNVEKIARAAVGCIAPQPCTCPICREKEETPP